MSRRNALVLLLCLAPFAAAAGEVAAGAGNIQIRCRPGVLIYLDGRVLGSTNAADGGLFITKVPAGPHAIKAVLGGHYPQEAGISLAADQNLEHAIRHFRPVPQARLGDTTSEPEPEGRTGSLIVQSFPIRATVEISGLVSECKGEDAWEAPDLAEGDYRITVSSGSRSLSHLASVRDGRATRLFFDLLSGKVEDRSPRPAAPAASEAAAAGGDWLAREEERRREQEERLRRERRREQEESLRRVVGEMVRIPGGEFEMGLSRGSDNPAHRVRVDDFSLGKSEVTQAQWRAVMGDDPSKFSGCDDCPVERVSWHEVQEFLRKAALTTGVAVRLPTEAEWEYAAGGGRAHQRWAGTESESDLEAYAWYGRNAGGRTHPVCRKRPNRFGLCDMTGNVWEWVGDWYGGYSDGNAENPQGPASGSHRVGRGGSWNSGALSARVASRAGTGPGIRSGEHGFRLVLGP